MKTNNFIKVMRWMRNHKKLIIFVITMILIAILASCMGGEGSSATLAVGMLITGVEEGKHVVDGPLTTDLTHEGSPDLLLNEIDQQIVKIRPMSTPIDQISRFAGSKHSGSMVVDYYSVDTKPTTAKLTQSVRAVSEQSSDGSSPMFLKLLLKFVLQFLRFLLLFLRLIEFFERPAAYLQIQFFEIPFDLSSVFQDN